jgi:hypothetical protein
METFPDVKISKRKLKGLLRHEKRDSNRSCVRFGQRSWDRQSETWQGFIYIKNGKQITEKKSLRVGI